MRKLAILSFAFSAAVFAAQILLPGGVLVPFGAALGLFCPLFWILAGQRRKRLRLAGTLVLLGLSAGLVWTAVYDILFFQPARELNGRTVLLHAVVADYPQETDYGFSVLVRGGEEGGRSVPAVLYTDGQGAGLRPGDRLEAVTHCTLADHTLSGEEITYYTAKGIFLLGETYGKLQIIRPAFPAPSHWPALLSQFLEDGIGKAFPCDTAPFVQALVTGNRDNLTDGFTTSLQRTGLSHMVVVSGMHLSVLSGLLIGLLGRGKRSTAAATGVWVVVFCGVAGNTPSVARAAVMVFLLQLAPLFRRDGDSPTSLGLALMLLLLWNPFSAAHVGLQLSFASVAGIELFSEKLRRRMLAPLRLGRKGPIWARFLRWVYVAGSSAVATTLGAMVFTVPLVAVHFGYLSVIAPISNLLVIQAVSFVFAGGLVCGLLGAVLPAIGAGLAVPFVWLARYVQWVVQGLSGLTLASVPLNSIYYGAWLVLCYLILFTGLAMKGRKRLILPTCACVTSFCLSLLLTAAGFRTGDLALAVLDVGQGQSVLLRSGAFLALLDCGGDGAVNAGDVAADYLQSLGENRLDLLVISHCHADHANGIPRLLERIEVSAIAMPGVEEEGGLREEILSLAEQRDIPVRLVETDTEYWLGNGGSLTLFAPLGEGTDTNELGLTALATAGGFDALITGDMGGQVEELLLSHADLRNIELLVAGHHGSATSTTRALLETAQPELAIISVGRNNRYGHPAQETLERLAAIGAEIYRTDLQGTVVIQANGRRTA